MRRLVSGVGWVSVAVMVVVAVARFSGVERSGAIQLQAFAPELLLPAYVVAAAALVVRRWPLAVAGGLLVVCHLLVVVPVLRESHAVPAAARQAPHLRLMEANLLYTNTEVEAQAAEFRRDRPDILVLEELTRPHLARLAAGGAFDGLPYSIVDPQPGSMGSGIWSRYPLEDAEIWSPGGKDMPRATVVVGRQRFRLYGVHTSAPTSRGAGYGWRAQLRALDEAARHEHLPVVLAGDFNATRDHRGFRRLLEGRTEAAGPGWAATWPQHRWPLPIPVLRLDHVVVSPGIVPLHVRLGTGPGSDHRPVIADLALLITDR